MGNALFDDQKTSIQFIVIMIIMHKMNLAGIDLNLLVTLEALLDEGHVGRAGDRVGLSQPATSHALARLRILFDDPLLVRSGRAMRLSPRAESLRAPLQALLIDVKSLLESEGFDPRESRRHFRMMLPDPAAHLIMPALMHRLKEAAPKMMIEGIGWRGPDLLGERDLREIDMIITSVQREWPGFDREAFYEDRDVAVVRRKHPHRETFATMEGLSRARHVSVVGAGERSDILDDWLAATAIVRDVAAVAPSYVAALRIASSTDLVAIVPGRLAQSFEAVLRLDVVPLPIDPGVDAMDLLCQKRLRADPATLWLKAILGELAQSMEPLFEA